MLQCRRRLRESLKVQQRNAPIQLCNAKRWIKSVSLAKLIYSLFYELLTHQSGANVVQANRFTLSRANTDPSLQRIAEQQKKN
jgi:hypothetical protein